MTEITRTREEIEQRLERLRDHEPVSDADYHTNQGAIKQLEWILSPDEAADDPNHPDKQL